MQVGELYLRGAEPTLWRDENLNDGTHEWLRHEFGAVPLTFFNQIDRCVRAGHLLSLEHHPELPHDFTAQAPATDAHVEFLAGAQIGCFTVDSQRASHECYEKHAPGRSSLHIFDGCGHLDVFTGDRAALDTFPTIVAALERTP